MLAQIARLPDWPLPIRPNPFFGNLAHHLQSGENGLESNFNVSLSSWLSYICFEEFQIEMAAHVARLRWLPDWHGSNFFDRVMTARLARLFDARLRQIEHFARLPDWVCQIAARLD